MKKIWNIVLVAAALVGCSKSDVVGEMEPVEISFGNAFIDNVTRSIDPSFSTTTGAANEFKEFKVWGFVRDYTGKMFEGELVSKQGNGQWSYTNKHYWTPNNTFYFAALSANYTSVTPATGDAAKNGLGKVKFTNSDGKQDLIYSSVTRTTGDLSKEAEYSTVEFTFNHLLSKVKFTFRNGFENINTFIAVENVTMEVPQSAEIDLAVPNWWDNTDDWKNHSQQTSTLSFGNMVAANEISENAAPLKVNYTTPAVSNYERFVIPASASAQYTVKFTVKLYANDVMVYTKDLSTVITGAALDMGKAYNFVATIGPNNIDPAGALEPIEFSVKEVKDWSPATPDNEFEL